MANEAFDRWWNSSKYMQVVYSGGAERQTALDAWNARALYLAPPTAQLEALRKERDAANARAETAEARVAELEKALDSIKAKVCGDAYPYWTSSENVTSNRMWIADVCDAARRVREGGKVDG